MKLIISSDQANKNWGNNAILSFKDTNTSIIHTQPSNTNDERLNIIQQAAKKLASFGIKTISLIGSNWQLEDVWAFYQGFYVAKKTTSISYPKLSKNDQNLLDAWIICSNFIKDVINMPASELTPKNFVEQAVSFIISQASNKKFIKYNIIYDTELLKQEYLGIWSVGKGSKNRPALLQLDYNPTGNPKAPVFASLVGKGITFDSGGYSIKPSDYMSSMRTDMGGAALLTGVLGLSILNKLDKRIKLYLCCADNAISDDAYRLGDIIKYRNGVTAEVLNTDAEGRLVLADGLIDASKDNPSFIIDCATLTGAAKIAVGNDYHSVLSMDDKLVNNLLESANRQNELFWRLPFNQFHKNQISSSFADIANISSVPMSAGASTAVAFLAYFVDDYQKNWLHIDCSATFRKSASELWSVGATAQGMRTLTDFLLELAKQ